MDSNHHVDSFDENYWCDLIDYSSLLDDVTPPADLCWNPQPQTQNVSVAMDVSVSGASSQASDSAERECPRKRGRSDPYGGTGTKACRERMRREKLNDRFSELSAILEPGRPVKTDKLAILGDAIRTLNQLKAETEEYTGMNKSLLEEIKNLKHKRRMWRRGPSVNGNNTQFQAEKNELREEKLILKVDKERMEQQLKTMNAPPNGFIPAHPQVYQTEVNKVPMFPSYGFVPMWHYLPPSARDISQDHELRPPAA